MGGGGCGCGCGFVGSGRDETMKRFPKCVRERERECEGGRLMKWLKKKGAKNEKGQKKKKKTEGKFNTRWGFKGLLRRCSTLQYTRTITMGQ